MKYDFDRVIDRQGTNTIKWEYKQSRGNPAVIEHTDEFFGEDRVLPMWIADMDFVSPKPVVDALVSRAQHGIFGYTGSPESYYAAVVRWMQKRHQWEIHPEWIVSTPGVVPAINMLVRTFISPGEKVLLQPPVYYPFYRAVERNGGEIVRNPLRYEAGVYRMDFDDLSQKIRDNPVKMAILSSPHNPVGRVWQREELIRFGEICLERDVMIVSDEIHGDLIQAGYTFTPFASLGQEFAKYSVTCTAPSKTFNLPGLHISNIIIPADQTRERYLKLVNSIGVSGVGPFGIVALEAAYRDGEDWLEQVLAYIQDNYRYLVDYFERYIPRIKVVPLEGTYLVWLDCRQLGLSNNELKSLFLDEARVYLDEGTLFGAEGGGFERINIACPRATLAEALERIRNAISRIS
jgi:cystathionine beta-lyase